MLESSVEPTRLCGRSIRWARGKLPHHALSVLVVATVAACQTPPPPQVQLDPAPVYEGVVTPVTGRVVLKVRNIADPAPYDSVSTMSLVTPDGARRYREHAQGRITAYRNNQDLITEISVERRNEEPLPQPLIIDIRHDEFRRPVSVQANLDALGGRGAEGASLLESFKRRVIPFRPAGYVMNEVVYSQPVAESYFRTATMAACRLGGETLVRGRRSYLLNCNGDGFAEMPEGRVMFSLDGYQIIDADTALPVVSKLRVIGNGATVAFSGVESMAVSLKEVVASTRAADQALPVATQKALPKGTNLRPQRSTSRH